MEAVPSSETSVNFYLTTRRNIPKYRNVYGHRCENLMINIIKILGITYIRALQNTLANPVTVNPDRNMKNAVHS
jgi:hypothetical protein